MEENKFEMKVRQKMEELRLLPSGAVWEKIEEELQRKKKRRIVFFLFSIVGICLLLGTAYLISSRSHSPNIDHSITATTSSAMPEEKTNPAHDPASSSSVPSTDPAAEESDPATHGDRIATSPSVPAMPLSQRASQSAKESPQRAGLSDGSSLSKDRSIGSATTAVAGKDQINTRQRNKRSVPDENNMTAVSRNGSIVPAIPQKGTGDDLAGEPHTDSGETALSNTATAAKDTQAAAAPVIVQQESKAPAAKKKKGSSVRWEIDLSGGIAGQRTITSSQKSLSPPVLSSPQSGNGNGPAGIPMLNTPSPVKAGAAFRAGVLMEWKVTKRSSFKTGLQYLYLGNSVRVGAYNDTAISFYNSLGVVQVNSVYRGVQEKVFHNRYHFLQVPVSYQLQLNKGNKLPILWEAGASLGYLFSTNALLYDEGLGGLYYHKKNEFNHFYTTLNTSLAFRFGNNKKIAWSIGPEFSLGLSGISKEGYNKKQKLMYGGIVGRILLPAKKK